MGTSNVHLVSSQHRCPHHGANEGERADGKENGESDSLRSSHPYALHDDEGNGEEEEIEDGVQNAECDCHVCAVATLRFVCSCAEIAEPEHGPYRDAHEDVAEDNRKHEDDEADEEGVVVYHPSLGGEACEAAVEEADGDLDHAD